MHMACGIATEKLLHAAQSLTRAAFPNEYRVFKAGCKIVTVYKSVKLVLTLIESYMQTAASVIDTHISWKGQRGVICVTNWCLAARSQQQFLRDNHPILHESFNQRTNVFVRIRMRISPDVEMQVPKCINSNTN